MAARLARIAARLSRLGGTVRGLSSVARGANNLNRIARFGNITRSAIRGGYKVGKVVSKPFKATFSRIGTVMRTKTGRGVRYSLTALADAAQLGYSAYEIALAVQLANELAAEDEEEVSNEGTADDSGNAEEEGGEGKKKKKKKGLSEWYYIDSITGEKVLLHSSEEAMKVYEAGKHRVYVHEDVEDVYPAGRREEAIALVNERAAETEALVKKMLTEIAARNQIERVRRSAEENPSAADTDPALAWHYRDSRGETVWLLTYEEALRAYNEGKEVFTLQVAPNNDNNNQEEEDGYVIKEGGNPWELVLQYYNNPGKDTLHNLAFFVGADYVRWYIDKLMGPDKVEHWVKLYPNWREEIKRPEWDKKGQEADKILRKYYFHPSSVNLWAVVAKLGLKYVSKVCSFKARQVGQPARSRAIWQTAEKILTDHIDGDKLMREHLSNPEKVTMDEVVRELGHDFVQQWAERTKEENKRNMHKMILATVGEAVRGLLKIPLYVAYKIIESQEKEDSF